MPIAPTAPTERAPAFAVALFVVIAALCLLAYAAISVPDLLAGGARELNWPARELGVSRGAAQLTGAATPSDGQALAVIAPDANGIALITVTATFRSADYSMVGWDALDVGDNVTATLLWRNDYSPDRLFTRPMSVDSGRIVPALVRGDPNWIGKITGVALALRGTLNQPIIIRGAWATPLTTTRLLRDRADEWIAFEPWNGASDEGAIGVRAAQALPPPALLAIVAALSAGIYALLARWRPGWIGAFRPGIVAAFLIASWFILDARWQANLTRQVERSFDQFAGKSSQERHLAAEDRALFAFIDKLRAKLPPNPTAARIFMAGDTNYVRGRGAYYLYPYNVYFAPEADSIPPAAAMRSGDYLVVVQRRNVQFDPAQQLLRWDGGASVPAELLLSDSGAAAFRIR
jgi:hypothetical protein